VTAVDVCIIRPANEEVDTRWLMWFLNAPQFRREVAAHQAGTTRKRISRKNLGSLLLPVPPVAEQHHIVAAIDEHFSHLDAGLAALAGASRNLQRLRTALLRDALVGEPLPLGAVTQFVRGVTYKKADASSLPGPNLVPVLRATNIQDGLTLHSDLVFVPRRCVADVQLLRPGDIVIAMSSGSSSVVGKSALLRSSWAGSFGAFCGVLRSLAGVDPVYLAHVLASREVRNRWSASAKGSNINNLKITDIASTMVPVPSLAEQRAIAATIDEQFSRLDATLGAVRRIGGMAARSSGLASRGLADSLRSALLSAAFSGRLVDYEAKDLFTREDSRSPVGGRGA
jgi:hypothetical protein